MSLVRASLISLLESEFSNPQLKSDCIKASSERILSDKTNRVFDDFPPLLPSETLLDLTIRFNHILTNITRFQQTDQGYILLDKKDIRALIQLQKKIIDIGCRDLLNSNGTINQEICQLMQWKQLLPKIDIVDLLCAYLAANNLTIMNKILPTINHYDNQYHAVCHYINTHYRTWVVDTFKSLNIPYHDRHNAGLAHDPSSESGLTGAEKAALGVGIGTATLAGLAVLGYAIFKAAETSDLSGGLGAQLPFPKR